MNGYTKSKEEGTRLIDDPEVIYLQALCAVARLTEKQWDELKAEMDSES